MKFLRQTGYNVLFFLTFLVIWPYMIYRLRKRGHIVADFWQRLGLYPSGLRRRLAGGCDLWIHAVSVGEVMLASVLINELRQLQPGLRIVLTATTATGQKVAKKLEDDLLTVVYNPIDFLWSVRQAYELFRPKRLILIEAEIWPNYIWCAKRRKIPVYLVNARLSQRTERRFRRFRFFCKPVLEEVDLVFAQNETDVVRLTRAGFASEAIFDLGSLKYDVANMAETNRNEVEAWWSRCGWNGKNIILMGGSTHPGEEEILAGIFHDLHLLSPELRLVLAPRHAERGGQVKAMCEGMCLRTLLRTELTQPLSNGSSPQALVLNSTGELKALYPKAHLVFVGKSLCGHGGQNFIEAIKLGTPTLVGPNMQNFLNQTEEFVKQGGLVQVNDEFELSQKIRELLGSVEQRRQLGEKGLQTFRKNLGAARKTAAVISASLNDQTPATASHS
jgi:3-deoxy-D-manno-octulosonic-acid transferase